MPYIQQSQRVHLDSTINELANKIKQLCVKDTDFAGILNYSVSKLILLIIPEIKYWSIALVSGVLSNISSEFYRRIGIPYEEKKVKENGDIF